LLSSAAGAITFKDFMRRSRELTGVDDLDPDLGRVTVYSADHHEKGRRQVAHPPMLTRLVARA